MNVETLDVGCGNHPRGTINTDLYITDQHNHRANEQQLTVKLIPNLIVCDCLHLPFINNAFEIVYCCQLIEHLPNPIRLLKELVRVSANRLIIETVHRLGERFDCFLKPKSNAWRRQHHISNFNVRWFINAAQALKIRYIRGYDITYTHIPSFFALIRFPYSFGVELAK